MTVNEALSALTALEAELQAYGHALGCLSYDGETVAPRNSAPARGQTMAFLSGIVHDRVTAPATGVESFSASGLFDPQAYLRLENSYTHGDKEYTIVGHKVEDFPEGFVRPDIRDRL